MESASPELPKSDTQKRHSIPYGPDEPIFFRPWNEVLTASQLSAAQQESFRSAVVHFLRPCKESECPATVVGIKAYLKHLGGSEARIQATTEALRWFYRQAVDYRDAQEVAPSVSEAVHRRVPSDRDQPSSGALDAGKVEWERALIRAIREQGFLRRKEQAYRSWGWRFADFVAPREIPATGCGMKCGPFLSELAVTRRSSRSTQKQALNACENDIEIPSASPSWVERLVPKPLT